MASGSKCIFFEISRPKSSSVSMCRAPPRREGRFIRRFVVLGRTISSRSVVTFLVVNGSTSEDSVLAVWEL